MGSLAHHPWVQCHLLPPSLLLSLGSFFLLSTSVRLPPLVSVFDVILLFFFFLLLFLVFV